MENKVLHFNLNRSEPPAVAGGFLFTIIVNSAKTHPLPQMVLTCPKSSGLLYFLSVTKGETASEEAKIESFYAAIKATNVLDDETGGMVETGEREDLCELTNVITEAAGLDPDKYGGGEGLASEWRDW